MAQVAGSTDTHRIGTAGGLREDLEDKIWDLFADETWALSNLDRTKATGTYHEWLTDSLVAPAANRQIEGDDASFVTIAAPTRVGNYCQISRKTFLVSGTLEQVSKAGRAKEAARQTMKQMRELKNDMEYAIVRNQGSSAGGSGTARSLASMESWLSTNEILATANASATTPGFSSGVVAAPTDGTTVSPLTEAALKSALEAAWQQGGDARIILVNTTNKAVIDGITGVALRQVDVGRRQAATIIGTANVYVSSYGIHTVVLHRHIRGSVVLAVDPDYWSLAFLRNPFMEQLAKTGDGTKYQMLSEFTLVCRNEKASAKVVACA